jgi:hypothetical protein
MALVPGLVFSIDPMIWIPEERLYVRMEDTVAVTGNGVENFTDFMPSRPADIEKLMRCVLDAETFTVSEVRGAKDVPLRFEQTPGKLTVHLKRAYR